MLKVIFSQRSADRHRLKRSHENKLQQSEPELAHSLENKNTITVVVVRTVVKDCIGTSAEAGQDLESSVQHIL